MSPDPNTPPNSGDLQFDKVAGVGVAPVGAMTCTNCGKPIDATYYQVGGKTICPACKAQIETQVAAHFAQGRSAQGTVRALVFGTGAALAGAAVYFGVAALTGLEIGLVAILIGYMVGYAVRKGSNGVGGRRFQILAVILTYLAVGAAYLMLGIKENAELSVPGMIIFMLAGPFFVVFSSGASGILSAIIIGVGLRQAWRMTAGATVAFKGPFKIAAATAPGAT